MAPNFRSRGDVVAPLRRLGAASDVRVVATVRSLNRLVTLRTIVLKVLHPLEVLQKVAHFLKISNFAANFKYEVGRENFTTIERLLQSGAVTRSSVQMLQAFFAPHDEALHKMFPGEKFY